MVEDTRILAGGGAAVTPTRQQKSGYSFAEEVRKRANVTTSSEEPLNRKAIARLDRILESNAPPREDVPRGFYLNILV
ncbi:MAG: hypothetical protein OQJ99_08330 [Rhodospirillales bacterium]|nr:hypothetical protein [Rhodospirillales bacterium]MCW8862867.1 hypothetical protein [Rhodospirillales bacterium]MCW8952230.1 hypothetical protein [Rhodospirillales bacterium]MCW8970108.1 hypothetical protein [Rhodospirillales bacterium]MCW9001596.1 hypothetical protein [Rhodospirillales bacterium]